MKTVRTVLGEITPEGLGPVNGHEHVFQVSPLLPGDELDDPERSSAEVELLRGSGFAAMIDATRSASADAPRTCAASASPRACRSSPAPACTAMRITLLTIRFRRSASRHVPS